MNFSQYLAHTNSLFLLMEVLPLRKIFFHKDGLITYKYSVHHLPESVAYLRFHFEGDGANYFKEKGL